MRTQLERRFSESSLKINELEEELSCERASANELSRRIQKERAHDALGDSTMKEQEWVRKAASAVEFCDLDYIRSLGGPGDFLVSGIPQLEPGDEVFSPLANFEEMSDVAATYGVRGKGTLVLMGSEFERWSHWLASVVHGWSKGVICVPIWKLEEAVEAVPNARVTGHDPIVNSLKTFPTKFCDPNSFDPSEGELHQLFRSAFSKATMDE